MEQTLIIFKPDAVQRGVLGEILSRFERVGLKIVGLKMIRPTRDQLHHHYETIGKVETRHGEAVFGFTMKMMENGPLVAAVLEGVESVELVRKMVGPTEPKSAAPGTIRGDYAHMSYAHANTRGIGVPNLIHASGSSDEAKAEVAHWFGPDELFDYEVGHEKHTR